MPNVQNLCLNAPPNQRISKIHKIDRKVSLWSAFKGITYPGVSRISAWADLADVCQPARLQFAGAGCIPWCLRFGWRSFGYRKEQINIEGTTKNKVHIMLLRSKTCRLHRLHSRHATAISLLSIGTQVLKVVLRGHPLHICSGYVRLPLKHETLATFEVGIRIQRQL